ncbi:AhpC/TSA family protein [bacterium M00.F.Ca.ET.228.01.1.1]|uniref:peroxiredoxin-like family protein n=1 Tax=Paraburkholderia phenoliruptrix TaxID=252970 RepID=UPI0010924119|nr:peroxiredoxin-like family protein [Paraburkholderia phenoliruptrix]TGP41819.1 AhpC/TSA family protein [bacterium M00.F.Ca.ET.228.01.1.1]TGR98610.1 AhpC/TSA family protein [bacterium M00.F.Ca.ET.191.01.1.1]TGU02945.1 AhpC/TSA family protein [bacterium M00.F.Ca.ET.155.01.1.1]MBW0447701.1 AhpC/TSA family protein [Paraburkholderia phenoliruptrix]MBW9098517.1 AhpC/TSA family protein [Paraburkholderia phenoliruptrix]
MSLQDKLDAFRADFKAGKAPFNAPPEIHPVMERATAELIASGQAARAIKAGDRVPHFNLKDQDGNDVSSAALLVNGPLVVTFYRGVWCPYCNIELQAINEVLPQIQAYGANVVAISPQTQVNSRKSVRTNQLGFPVLSDVNGQTAADFGLRFALPDYLVELYKNLKNDLPAFNNDPGWTLPMPARYVIGQDGIVLYSEVNPDYTRRPDPSDMFPVLEKATANA